MIVIDTWRGLVTNGSPYALPPGAAVSQTNFQCRRPGELTARGGQAALTITTHTGATVPVIEIFRAPIAGVESVIYQNLSGNLFVAKGVQ